MALPLLALALLATLARAPGGREERIEPLLGAPEERWSFGPLVFEGAPQRLALPEGERILVHGRDSTSRRALVVLDGASGRVLTRTLFPAQTPLALAAAGERVAVRSAPGRVDLFRLRGARLLLERSFTHAESLSAPRLTEHELLLREGGELARYELSSASPTWRARPAGAFRGDPDVRGEHVFAGWHAADGSVHLAWLERASGRGRGDLVLGRPRAPLDDGPDSLLVVAHADGIFSRLAPPLPATNGAELPWTLVPFDGERLGTARLFDFLAAPLESATGWIAPERAADGAARWILVRRGVASSEGTLELASGTHHAWLGRSHAGAGRAGEVLYLGGAAADERSLQVLWRRPRASDFPPLAVPGGLLVIEGERLVCLGPARSALDPGLVRARAVVAQEERELGERLALLASKALRSGDTAYAGELVAEAEGLGATGRTLELVRAEAGRLRAAPAGSRPGARRAALASEEQAARDAVAEGLADAARLAREPRETRALLAELFRRDPEHAGGRRELQALLPAGVEVEGSPLAWLELAAAAAARPITRVDPAAPPKSSPAAARLAEERERWRADASAYESERLLVITAGSAPHAVARTLTTGEYLCDVLEQVFGGARGGAARLELVLYPTRAEYLEHSGTDLGGLEKVLGFTAGHFDLGARVSRLYLPEEDADGERLLDVAAHELTHHWLALRSPYAPLRASPATAGFWVVEGIATWVEELALDPAGRTWSSAPDRAPSLDTVRNAGPRDLLGWRELLAGSCDDYRKLETRPTCLLALDWQLGTRHPRSPMQLFYAQGAALAHYLYEADEGRYRGILLGAVEGYYRGQPLDVAQAMGVSAEELGMRVVAWATESP